MTQHIDQWRRAAIAKDTNESIGHVWPAHQPRCSQLLNQVSVVLSIAKLALQESCCTARTCTGRKRVAPPQFVLFLAVTSLTGMLGDRFYNQPKLDVGKTAPQTIRAPGDAKVIDNQATEAKRKAIRQGLIPVLMVDRSVNQQIYQELQGSIDRINELRSSVGSFPFTGASVLSTRTQLYLRDAQDWEWRAVQAAVNPQQMGKSQGDALVPNSLKLETAIAQLQAYRRSTSTQRLSLLLERIKETRQRYEKALSILAKDCHRGITPPLLRVNQNNFAYTSTKVLSDSLNPSNCGYPGLLRASITDWQTTQIGIRTAAERILTQGIPPGLPIEQLQEAVRIQVNNQVPQYLHLPATQLLMTVLKPNLTKDDEQTRLLAEQALQTVQSEIIEIRKGQVIVWAGEKITQEDFLVLDHFHLSRRGLDWLGLIGFGSVVSAAIVVFWLVQRRFHGVLRRRDYLLVLLLVLSTPLMLRLGIRYTSLPAVGLLVGSFYGSALGAIVVGLLSLIVPFSMDVGWEHLLASAAGGMLGGIMAGRMRSREELALLGVAVGLTEGIVYLLVHLILGTITGWMWYPVLRKAALYSLTGLAWSVVALGLSPYLEHLFDLLTSVRLAELANPSRPLLKRLAEEAPGTFQHTMLVATLAESAAKALGCNAELVRTGTLYHDIGKLHDAQAFIENQMGKPNKHDEIDDAWISAAIIKKHVSEGLVMARKHRLPKAIQAFIPEHQGTMAIAYFYHRALQDPRRPVHEEDFRYDGPIPQSRETGLVMLADGCEAALRSLKDATYEEAISMVNKMLRSRWQEGQLIDSGLRREEMPLIAQTFVQVWQQYHHKRIAYPKLTVKA